MTATAAADTEHDDDDRGPTFEFTSRRGRTIPPEDKIPFTLDGDQYTMIRPKISAALGLHELAESADVRTVTSVGRDLINLAMSLLRYIEVETPEPEFLDKAEKKPNPKFPAPRGRMLLTTRLDDVTDGLDISDLLPIFQTIGQEMFGRPTGASPEPSARRATQESRGSAAGSRSTQRKTSGRSGTAHSS